jgi:hypothetical protein
MVCYIKVKHIALYRMKRARTQIGVTGDALISVHSEKSDSRIRIMDLIPGIFIITPKGVAKIIRILTCDYDEVPLAYFAGGLKVHANNPVDLEETGRAIPASAVRGMTIGFEKKVRLYTLVLDKYHIMIADNVPCLTRLE